MSSLIKDKWGEDIKSEITGLFDNDIFILNEKSLAADKISTAKSAHKTKLNKYGDFAKLKERFCLRGDMQIKDDFTSLSPTVSTRLSNVSLQMLTRTHQNYMKISYMLSFSPRLLKECLLFWTKSSLISVQSYRNTLGDP